MSHKRAIWACLGLVLWLSSPARADLYAAVAAADSKDFTRAFELFRELAELGHPEAQENLAVMYVNGEGVKRDNVLGYAWARLALESQEREAARSIVNQLEPHLKDGGRARIAALHAQFGKAALQASLFPDPKPPPADPAVTPCRMKTAADPDFYYPLGAKRSGTWGDVLVEVRVQADGSVRLPRTWYSFPAEVFEEAGRAVALNSGYTPKLENGRYVPCTMRFKVKFRILTGGQQDVTREQLKIISALRTAARAGDPASQLSLDLATSLRPEFRAPEDKDTDWRLRAAQAGVPAAQFLIGIQMIGLPERPGYEAKGLRWLEMSAKGGSGAGMTSLASYWLGSTRNEEERQRGFEWLERAAGTTHREGRYLFASLLASWPDPARRDYTRALAIMKDIGDSFDYDPLSFEIRAAAHAGLGEFKDAARIQSRAVKIASKLGWDTQTYEARLAAYEAGRAAEGELIRF